VKAVFDIRQRTLVERARLVLRLDADAPEAAFRRAYREMAGRHHPDHAGGSTRRFQLVREAYGLLSRGALGRHPLLADDALVSDFIGLPEASPTGDAGRRAYATWQRQHFFGDW
jgi:curved DNA-binding protein CbpA